MIKDIALITKAIIFGMLGLSTKCDLFDDNPFPRQR